MRGGGAQHPRLLPRALSDHVLVPRDPCREKSAFSPIEVVLGFFVFLKGVVVTRTIFVAIETETS